jgi:hypothetical protein
LGFDWEKLPFLKKFFSKENEPRENESENSVFKFIPDDLEDLNIIINQNHIFYKDIFDNYNLEFEPSAGWKGCIESAPANEVIIL